MPPFGKGLPEADTPVDKGQGDDRMDYKGTHDIVCNRNPFSVRFQEYIGNHAECKSMKGDTKSGS